MKIDDTLKALEQTLIQAESAKQQMISDFRNLKTDDPNVLQMQNDLPKLAEEMGKSDNPIKVYLDYAKKIKSNV